MNAIQIGNKVTLPEYVGFGVNYGNVKNADIVKIGKRVVTVRFQNSPEMARMFGALSEIKIPIDLAIKYQVRPGDRSANR